MIYLDPRDCSDPFCCFLLRVDVTAAAAATTNVIPLLSLLVFGGSQHQQLVVQSSPKRSWCCLSKQRFVTAMFVVLWLLFWLELFKLHWSFPVSPFRIPSSYLGPRNWSDTFLFLPLPVDPAATDATIPLPPFIIGLSQHQLPFLHLSSNGAGSFVPIVLLFAIMMLSLLPAASLFVLDLTIRSVLWRIVWLLSSSSSSSFSSLLSSWRNLWFFSSLFSAWNEHATNCAADATTSSSCSDLMSFGVSSPSSRRNVLYFSSFSSSFFGRKLPAWEWDDENEDNTCGAETTSWAYFSSVTSSSVSFFTAASSSCTANTGAEFQLWASSNNQHQFPGSQSFLKGASSAILRSLPTSSALPSVSSCFTWTEVAAGKDDDEEDATDAGSSSSFGFFTATTGSPAGAKKDDDDVGIIGDAGSSFLMLVGDTTVPKDITNGLRR